MGTGSLFWMESARKHLYYIILALSHIIPVASLCFRVTAPIIGSQLRTGKWVCRLLKNHGYYLQRVMGIWPHTHTHTIPLEYQMSTGITPITAVAGNQSKPFHLIKLAIYASYTTMITIHLYLFPHHTVSPLMTRMGAFQPYIHSRKPSAQYTVSAW